MADMTGIAAQVERTKGVAASATILINTFRQRLDAAIADAVKANDDADLSALTDLSASLETETAALASAVETNP